MKLRTILINTAPACAINYDMTYWLARVAVLAEKVEEDEYCATPLPQIPTPCTRPTSSRSGDRCQPGPSPHRGHRAMSDSSAPARIVVGVDGSAHSDAALRWALRQAALTSAHIEAVACWQRPPMMGAYAPAAYVEVDLAGPTGDAARAAIAGAVEATPGTADVTVQITVVEGYPAGVLIDAAADADLLVVGSRGHGELSSMLLGSVGLHAATHSPCPVVIVHDQIVKAHSHRPISTQ